jgi:hypothetical protein
MHAFATTEASGLLVHAGELEGGCRGLADMVQVWFRAGEWSQQWHTMSRCVIALHRIGERDLAAEAMGAIEARATLGVAPMTAMLRRDLFETRTTLATELGPERTAALRARGAGAPVANVVLRTRDALRGLDGA